MTRFADRERSVIVQSSIKRKVKLQILLSANGYPIVVILNTIDSKAKELYIYKGERSFLANSFAEWRVARVLYISKM